GGPATARPPPASTAPPLRVFRNIRHPFREDRDRWRNSRRRAGRELDGGVGRSTDYKLASARLYVKRVFPDFLTASVSAFGRGALARGGSPRYTSLHGPSQDDFRP